MFLENGDILTDRALDSSADPSKAMCYDKESNAGQTRIGTVRSATVDSDGNLYIRPSIILAGENFGVLDGTMVGIPNVSGSVKINIPSYKKVSSGPYGSVLLGIFNDDAPGELPASWTNKYNYFTFLQLSYYYGRNKDEQAKLPTPTNKQKLEAQRRGGFLSIKTSPCYSIKQK